MWPLLVSSVHEFLNNMVHTSLARCCALCCADSTNSRFRAVCAILEPPHNLLVLGSSPSGPNLNSPLKTRGISHNHAPRWGLGRIRSLLGDRSFGDLRQFE